jgi:hypothetical protein
MEYPTPARGRVVRLDRSNVCPAEGGGCPPMDSILPMLLLVAMGATAIVLAVGVISFAFSSRMNQKYATKLMTTRVMLQGIAVLLFGLIVLLHGH